LRAIFGVTSGYWFALKNKPFIISRKNIFLLYGIDLDKGHFNTHISLSLIRELDGDKR